MVVNSNIPNSSLRGHALHATSTRMAHVIHTMLWQVMSGFSAARIVCTHGLQELAAWLEKTEHPVLSCLL